MKKCNCEDLLQEAAEYQGRKVTLNNPTRSSDGKKKFYVYVKNEKGNVVKVNFGQGGDAKGGTMRIRKSNPKARKAFRARHNCDSPGPRHKARYWSCRKWQEKIKWKNVNVNVNVVRIVINAKNR